MRRPRYDPSRFNARRYRGENIALWVPLLVHAARIGPSDVVVDLGCGTGGFTAAMGPNAIGIELDTSLADRLPARLRAADGQPYVRRHTLMVAVRR